MDTTKGQFTPRNVIFEWVFAKSPEIRCVVNKVSKYFHVLIYDIEHTVITC